jgi:hypothetical protein
VLAGLLLAAVAAALLLVDVLSAEKGAVGGAPGATPVLAGQGAASTTASAAPPGPRVWPEELICPSERSFKADQIEQLGHAPEVVFFGGSRSTRFEPSHLKERTGLEGFNLAMTNGRPEDAWVFAHFLHERAPDTRLRWVWGVQPTILSDRDLEAGLVQDPRLNRYLPAGLLRAQGESLPQTPEEVPASGRVEQRKYSRDGVILSNSYDRDEAKGVTLASSLEKYIEVALKKQTTGVKPKSDKVTRGREYFEATLGYLNEIGAEPVIVAMPVHPLVLEALRPGGWQEHHERFVAYLDSLHDQYEFEFIDLSDIESFDGDPDDFYDGVHIKAANGRRVIDALVRAFPETFAP